MCKWSEVIPGHSLPGHGCTPLKGLSLRLGYDRQLPRVYGVLRESDLPVQKLRKGGVGIERLGVRL